MRKIFLLTCCMTALMLPCMAQVMRLPPMEDIRADLRKTHTDSGRADLLLNLALSYVFKPGEFKSDLDSARLWTKQAESINARLKDKRLEAKTFFVYSNIQREGGNSTAGHQAIERSLALYKTIDAPSDMAEALIEETNYYSGDDDAMYEKKKVNYAQALDGFKHSGNRLREADALKNIGDFDNALDKDPRLSMKELKEALAIYTSLGYEELYGVYITLANLCNQEGDYPNLLRYCELAVKYGERTGDTSLQMSRIYAETGKAYMQLNNFEKAISFEKKAIAIGEKYDTLDYYVPMVRDLCHSLVRAGRGGEAIAVLKSIEKKISMRTRPLPDFQQSAYLSTQILVYNGLKQYEKAAFYARQDVRVLNRHPATNYVYLFSSPLVEYFIGTHQGKEAGMYADSLLRFALATNVMQNISRCYLEKSKADSAVGDLRSSLANYKRYKITGDSVLNEASGFQLAQVQVEVETDKKDNDIKILQQQQEIQKSRLDHSRTTNTIVIFGVVILALLLALLYSRYRTKQRLNKEKDQLITEKDTLLNEKDTLIAEKDWLVKEIHHRVKNNLQIVISLLNAQTEFLDNPSARSAIQQSRERMEAIAIVHQKLYQTEDNTLIHVRTYIYELVENLQDSFAGARNIHFQLNIADIVLDISQSVPLGLILNEAITNAIKYAYLEGEYGTVSISLQIIFGDRIELKIADNGKGLTPGLDWKNSASLGLQLINLLAQQLNAELFFRDKNGLEIVLIFKPTLYTPSATTTLTTFSFSS
jgi:two-component system, sensor histidine kinase PdtaS